MTKIRDGKARDCKRAKRGKMRVGSRSVFLIQEILRKRAEKYKRSKK